MWLLQIKYFNNSYKNVKVHVLTIEQQFSYKIIFFLCLFFLNLKLQSKRNFTDSDYDKEEKKNPNLKKPFCLQ